MKLSPHWNIGDFVCLKGRMADWRRHFWAEATEPFIVRWHHGIRIYLHPDDETSRILYFTGQYEPNEFFLLNQMLKRGMNFLDLGANNGLYSLFAAQKVGKSGRVIAVEPSSREYQRLEMNISINGFQNIVAVNAAIFDSSGQAEILIAEVEHSGHNTLGGFIYDTRLSHRESVRTETVDGLIKNLNLKHLDFIKMDLEGAEYKALVGAVETIEKFRPSILVEISEASLQNLSSSSEQVLFLLKSHGYVLHVFDPETGRPVRNLNPDCSSSQNLLATPNSA